MNRPTLNQFQRRLNHVEIRRQSGFANQVQGDRGGNCQRAGLGRIGQPTDIAPIAVFLASDESGWLTGEIILDSGGQR